MKFLIFYYDWLILKSNKMLLTCFMLLTLFMIFAFWVGNKRISFQYDTISKVQQIENQNYTHYKILVAHLEKDGLPFKGNSHRDPTQPDGAANATANHYFILEHKPLALLSSGQSDLYPYYYKFSLNKKQALYHSEEIENASILYNGYFDVSFVIIFLLPLFIIALTYNIFSIEKEMGTLSILMASNTSVLTVLVNKFLFRLTVFTLFVSIIITIGVCAFGIPIFKIKSSLGWLLVIVFFYSTFWFGLSFFVNSYGRNSGFNASVLIGVWFTLLIIIPSFLNMIANILHPIPSRIELIAETREISDSIKKNSNQLLSKYLEDHPELMPRNKPIDMKNSAILSLRSNMAVEEAIQPLEDEFKIQRESQERVWNNYRIFSPTIFVQQMLNNIAGTNEERYQDFQEQMLVAHKQYKNFFAAKIFRQEKMSAADYDKVPKPFYRSEKEYLYTTVNFLNLFWLLFTTSLFIFLGFRNRKVNSLPY